MDIENNKNNKIWNNLVEIINVIKTVDRKYIFISLFFSVVGGFISPLSTIILQKILNGIQNKVSINYVGKYIILYLIIVFIYNISSSLYSYYNSKFNMNFELYVSESILRKASKLSLRDYENSETYDIISRAQNEDGSKLINFYNQFLNIISQFVTLISYLLILLTFKYWIVIVIIICPVIKYIINSKYNLKIYNINRDRTNDKRKSTYLNFLLTYGNFYKEIKIFNLFDYFLSKYKEYWKRFINEDLNILKSRTIIFTVILVLESIIDGSLFFYIVLLGLKGTILIGSTITYIKAMTSFKSYFSSILLNISNLMRESLFIENLFEYYSLKEIDDKDKILIDKIEEIEVKNLYFKYSNSDEYCLKNISLKISRDEKIAILGLNGSGKSTLVKIIMGYYLDYEGDVYINGVDLKEINRHSLQLRISALFQDFVKYEATLRENIGYGNVDILDNDTVLNRIVDEFNLANLLDNNDLDTQLGTWFDKGKDLSIGQWQKVALARAFAKECDVCILDEPNASLDVITESELSRLYEKLLKDKLAIVISHKLNHIIKFVDRIIVMDKGEIIESGSHDDLLEKNGLYSRLYLHDK